MKDFIHRSRVAVYGAVGAVAGLVAPALSHAALTMPTLPTDDLYTAGTAILGLIAIGAVIGMVAKTFRKAG